MRNVVGIATIALTLIGGAGVATAQVADHSVVSGSERNLEQHPKTGGATSGRTYSHRYSTDRFERHY
jgi:hypothetical protein